MGLTGATETSYTYLAEHYQFPDNVFVSHLPEQLKSLINLLKFYGHTMHMINSCF